MPTCVRRLADTKADVQVWQSRRVAGKGCRYTDGTMVRVVHTVRRELRRDCEKLQVALPTSSSDESRKIDT